MKKATCTAFVNILNTIHEKGITTKAALMANPFLQVFGRVPLQNRIGLLEGGSGNRARIGIRLDQSSDALDIRLMVKSAWMMDLGAELLPSAEIQWVPIGKLHPDGIYQYAE